MKARMTFDVQLGEDEARGPAVELCREVGAVLAVSTRRITVGLEEVARDDLRAGFGLATMYYAVRADLESLGYELTVSEPKSMKGVT